MVKERKTSPILIVAIVFLVVAIILGIYLNVPATESKNCVTDDDCIVFGESGDCNCGCFNKNYEQWEPGGKCFCAAPIACECVNANCEGLFDVNDFETCAKVTGQVMESYPRQCRYENKTFVEESCQSNGNILTLADAEQIAKEKCGEIKETYVCNEFTGTYWIDLVLEKTGCNPACVVNIETIEAEINWRCTGLIE
ncbi:MAG: hypothetical protein GTN36_06305 [Candidatus Aenigmarchaeota archaeon]|nr:hypothetical protein [Candidatus Aenigmarchaeota archaeon]